jgi:hypothetical protein
MYGEKQSRDTWAGMMSDRPLAPPSISTAAILVADRESLLAGVNLTYLELTGVCQTVVCRVSGSSAIVRYPQRAILRTNDKSLVGATAKQ